MPDNFSCDLLFNYREYLFYFEVNIVKLSSVVLMGCTQCTSRLTLPLWEGVSFT